MLTLSFVLLAQKLDVIENGQLSKSAVRIAKLQRQKADRARRAARKYDIDTRQATFSVNPACNPAHRDAPNPDAAHDVSVDDAPK